MNKTIEILMSAMHQTDASLVTASKARTDIVLVNQCDREELQTLTYTDEAGQHHKATIVSTRERGLSRSRNMAIRHATADICVIADDDEVFDDAYADIILKAYEDYPEADIIAFQVENDIKLTYPDKPARVGYKRAMQTCSLEITFRRQRIIDKGISFDEEMGSGTGHGACEEIKFLFDSLRRGLRIQYVPMMIARLHKDSASQWFHGYDRRYFFNQGWATRRFLGPFFATLYAFYYGWRKRKLYQSDISMPTAIAYILKGIGHRKYPEK